MKIHNRALVLRIIQQKEMISRKEISRLTGLTPATITTITNALLGLGLVAETGKDTRSSGTGRKQIYLSINRGRHKIIALNLGRSMVQRAVCDLAGNILHRSDKYVRLIQDNRLVMDRLGDEVVGMIRELIREFRVDPASLLGISIAAPGPLNAEKGIMRGTSRESPAPFDWRDIHLKETVQRAFGVNVFVDNDANISALGESWFGAGVGVSNLVVYMIGIGTGAGVIIDGMLYRGEDDVVSEIGHVTIDYRGPRCRCGNVGCLELYSNFHNIIDTYDRAAGAAGAARVAAGQMDNEAAVARISEIFRRAADGEEAARAVLTAHGDVLGVGAVTLANTFSPEAIIVSANELGDLDLSLLLERIQEAVRRRAFSVIADKVRVIGSTLGRDVTLYGGIALVLQDFFSNVAAQGEGGSAAAIES
ncbi:MAG TPA: ROK family transcriptional regulator [bacterium]|nr:ROK family transcriptional regulator [bacterium]